MLGQIIIKLQYCTVYDIGLQAVKPNPSGLGYKFALAGLFLTYNLFLLIFVTVLWQGIGGYIQKAGCVKP